MLTERHHQDYTLNNSRDIRKMNCILICQMPKEHETNHIFTDISKIFHI